MPQQTPIDYAALAEQARRQAAKTQAVNYAALAEQARITASPAPDSPPTSGMRDRIAQAATATANDPIINAVGNFLAGAGKGAANTAMGLGQFLHTMVPPVRWASDLAQQAVYGDVHPAGPMFDQARAEVQPVGTAQQAGNVAEQVAEYFIPGAAAEKLATGVAARILPLVTQRLARQSIALGSRSAMNAGMSAGMTGLQGGDVSTAAKLGAAMPVVGGSVTKAAGAVGSMAAPLVRAAIKPTVTAMKQQAGASVDGIDAIAKRLTQFIIDHNLRTPAKAEALIKDAERRIQATLKTSNAVTDAPQRAMRYLGAVKKSASRQALPADDVRQIVAKGKELVRTSPLAETVMRPVLRPQLDATGHAMIDPKTGQTLMQTVMEPTRRLRTDVMADEALELARGSSKWGNKKAWGELKGAQTEANKAVERGTRDAVKAAVPATKPDFAIQKGGIQAKAALDRMAFRQANRDVGSLPSHVIAAGEIARGKVPLLSMAANYLRNNQMKIGIWAKRLEEAIKNQDTQTVGEILGRLGVVTASKQGATP